MRSNDRVHAVARRPPSVFGDNQFPRVRVERGEGGLDRNLYLPGCGRLRPGRRIYRPMPDQEHRPTGSDAGRQALHQLFDGSCHVHVEADNEVVGGSSRRPRRKIGLDPVDAPRDVDSHGVGCRAGMVQSRRGEVDCRDVPPPAPQARVPPRRGRSPHRPHVRDATRRSRRSTGRSVAAALHDRRGRVEPSPNGLPKRAGRERSRPCAQCGGRTRASSAQVEVHSRRLAQNGWGSSTSQSCGWKLSTADSPANRSTTTGRSTSSWPDGERST
jgi:hypothetical protein